MRKTNRVQALSLAGNPRTPVPLSAGSRSSRATTPSCHPNSRTGWEDVIAADPSFQYDNSRVPSALMRVKAFGAPPASEAFKVVLHDIYTRKRQLAKQRVALSAQRKWGENARKAAASRAQTEKELSAIDGDDDESDSDSLEAFVLDHQRTVTLRRWALVRRKMHELSLERKQTNAALNWSFLHHAVQTGTTMEEVRKELYKKYLHNTDSWTEGFTNFPKHLFVKARKTCSVVATLQRLSRTRVTKKTQ